jgi:hypothetical protein
MDGTEALEVYEEHKFDHQSINGGIK